MKIPKTVCAALCLGVASLGPIDNANAQTSEALMDALVRKGILTEQEAEDIKADVAKENRQHNKLTLAGKTVNGLNLYGDFRGRFEAFAGDNAAFKARHRFRYRLRVGAIYSLTDNAEVGFRLTSSEASGTFGGDPISGNTTFQDNGSKKFVYIDQAYGKWSPILTPEWTASIIVGKMDNPFVFSDLVFDGDYTPEGAAMQFVHVLNDKHTFRSAAGAFLVDEIGSLHNDPYYYGGQIRWDAAWTKKVATSGGLAMLSLVNDQNLHNTAVPNVNRGNTRASTTSGGATNPAPAFNFNPIIVDAAITFTPDRFPLYPGPFPIRIGGDYMINPAAESSAADHYGYSVGVTLGKAGKRGAWELGYTWKWLGADAWYEEFVDSDFGAFYEGTLSNSGLGTGYGSGTGVQGHVARLSYSPFDAITLATKVFFTELIDPLGTGSSDMIRWQVDANWKF